MPVKNILVTVDFSDLSDDVVAKATSIAAAFSAKVQLLHVADPDPDFVGYDAGPQTTRDAVANSFRDQHRQLQAMAEKLRDSGLDCDAILVQGPYVEKILSESKSLDADLIVIGAHSKGLVSRVLLGSVSEGVLRKSHIPVMVVPAR